MLKIAFHFIQQCGQFAYCGRHPLSWCCHACHDYQWPQKRDHARARSFCFFQVINSIVWTYFIEFSATADCSMAHVHTLPNRMGPYIVASVIFPIAGWYQVHKFLHKDKMSTDLCFHQLQQLKCVCFFPFSLCNGNSPRPYVTLLYFNDDSYSPTDTWWHRGRRISTSCGRFRQWIYFVLENRRRWRYQYGDGRQHEGWVVTCRVMTYFRMGWYWIWTTRRWNDRLWHDHRSRVRLKWKSCRDRHVVHGSTSTNWWHLFHGSFDDETTDDGNRRVHKILCSK